MNDHASQAINNTFFADVPAFREYVRARLRIPVATYRMQLQPGFTFQDAKAIVPYLAQLGITDCYCSPYFQARPGSTHGYDICDYGELNNELGGEAGYDAFVQELTRHEMGHVLDFVPNHMAVEAGRNRWWWDMLENGPASPYARFFDIDWDPIKPELKGKILLPFLGDHYGRALERGELQLVYHEGELLLRYFGHDRPIDPRQYPQVLRTNLEALQAELKADDPQLQEFLSIMTALSHLPAPTDTALASVAERLRESKLARERLARLIAGAPRIRQHIDDALRVVNGVPGQPASFDALHALLEAQSYRLAYWKTAIHEINFRRFFDINQLAGLRMEDPAVFAATHTLVLRLIREGKVNGLRLDHIDGLFDPAEYLATLQAAILEEWAAEFQHLGNDRSPEWREQFHAWLEREMRDSSGAARRPFYLLIEKILSGNETLPDAWPIHGTTGYDFLNDLNRLFIDPRDAKAMKRIHARFTGQAYSFADVVYYCKRLITATSLASELNVLAAALNGISEGDRRARDFTLDSLRHALREIVACFPVYRTYVSADGATQSDRQTIDLAIKRARRRNPAMEASAYDFIREVLLPDKEKLTEEEYQARLNFTMKFQQYTAPLQAKGMEDTAFYRYNVLVSLNEVGGDPQRFGGTTAHFHDANLRRFQHSPATMLATATHDTKRGEDARARINVLSELPDAWGRQITRWSKLNARNRATVEGEPAPDRNDEYLFYQTLLGCRPAELANADCEASPPDLVQRLRDYMLKAVKEAKVHTSWMSPNDSYDQAVANFVEQTLAGPRSARFLADFLPFQQRIARLGMVNSLAQTLLKIVSPGVPDFYQGTELWDLSLVDPDNRQPVDFVKRRQLFDAIELLLSAENRVDGIVELLEHWPDGRIKLFLTVCGLRFRQQFRRVFQEGEYLPILARGEHAEHVIAIARRFENRCILAVAPRLVANHSFEDRHLPSGPTFWKETRLVLPESLLGGRYRNLLTLESLNTGLPLGEVLRDCPVALLAAEDI